MTLMSMTFHESYGELPTALLKAYKRYNASPADHDRLLAAFGPDNWSDIFDTVLDYSEKGYLDLPWTM